MRLHVRKTKVGSGDLRPAGRNVLIGVIVLLPLLFLVGSSVAALANRIYLGWNKFGAMTRTTAVNIALEQCTLLTGEAARGLDAHTTGAYERSAHRRIYQWEVICRAETNDYAVRIDGSSGRVFGFNVISGSTDPGSDGPNLLTFGQAADRARQYLRLLMGASARLELLTSPKDTARLPEQAMNFRLLSPHGGSQTINIAINMHNGSLKTFWRAPAHRNE